METIELIVKRLINEEVCKYDTAEWNYKFGSSVVALIVNASEIVLMLFIEFMENYLIR